MRIESSTSPETLASGRRTQQQQAIISKLAATDQHVRAHEQAHLAAAGGYARSGAAFTYTRGPDGQIYAVAGEVSIDASAVEGDPEATVRKAEVVRAAAEAPADPSPQDRKVAAQANSMEAQARLELAQLQEAAIRAGKSRASRYSEPSPSGAGALLSLIA